MHFGILHSITHWKQIPPQLPREGQLSRPLNEILQSQCWTVTSFQFCGKNMLCTRTILLTVWCLCANITCKTNPSHHVHVWTYVKFAPKTIIKTSVVHSSQAPSFPSLAVWYSNGKLIRDLGARLPLYDNYCTLLFQGVLHASKVCGVKRLIWSTGSRDSNQPWRWPGDVWRSKSSGDSIYLSTSMMLLSQCCVGSDSTFFPD